MWFLHKYYNIHTLAADYRAKQFQSNTDERNERRTGQGRKGARCTAKPPGGIQGEQNCAVDNYFKCRYNPRKGCSNEDATTRTANRTGSPAQHGDLQIITNMPERPERFPHALTTYQHHPTTLPAQAAHPEASNQTCPSLRVGGRSRRR